MRGLEQSGYKVHFETFLLDRVFFRCDASLNTLYPAVHSNLNTLGTSSPLPNLIEIGGRRGENYIEPHNPIRQFYF